MNDDTRIAGILADPRCKEMRREIALGRESSVIDKEKRTVEMSFASELPVDRWFGREILDISPDSADLSRLNGGGAVLVNHDWDRQVGVVEKAWIDAETKKARALVKFSRTQAGEDIFLDVQDGVRSLVSVGYIVRKMQLQSVEGDLETHRVTDWMPYEISVVSVPADPSVGIGRSKPKEDNRTVNIRTAMSDTNAPPVAPNVDLAAERARVRDLNASAKVLADRYPNQAEAIRSLASKCAETGDTVDSFNRAVIYDVLKTEPATPTRQIDTSIGMKPKDVKRYSIMRAIQRVLDNRPLDGLERECSDEVQKQVGRAPNGFFLPDEVYFDRRSQRTLVAGNNVDGGYTIGSELMTSEWVEYLRNNTVVMELGARMITGLKGDITIPRQLTGATVYWVSETGTITASGATFGQITGKPRRIGTSIPYSKQFLAQTSISAEQFVVQDSDKAMAVDLDRVALRGVGGVEPLGIAYLASGDRSSSVTFSTSPTWAKYLEFMSSVVASNALLGQPAYVASVASAVKAATVAKFSNTSDPIWNLDAGRVGPFRARYTTQLLTSATPVANMVIFGDFSQVMYLEWAGRDVVVDPYGSNATGGTVTVTIQRLIDCIIRQGKSFAQSADSGAQ